MRPLLMNASKLNFSCEHSINLGLMLSIRASNHRVSGVAGTGLLKKTLFLVLADERVRRGASMARDLCGPGARLLESFRNNEYSRSLRLARLTQITVSESSSLLPETFRRLGRRNTMVMQAYASMRRARRDASLRWLSLDGIAGSLLLREFQASEGLSPKNTEHT